MKKPQFKNSVTNKIFEMGKIEIEKPDIVDSIIAYECGDMSDQQTIDFFQSHQDTLINLQGAYGRQLSTLINTGYVIPSEKNKGLLNGRKFIYRTLN